jgi:hypothetical protein
VSSEDVGESQHLTRDRFACGTVVHSDSNVARRITLAEAHDVSIVRDYMYSVDVQPREDRALYI